MRVIRKAPPAPPREWRCGASFGILNDFCLITMTITVQPNQSMLDVIVQAMGTLEGGMCFCGLNCVAISDTPVVGTVYQVPSPSPALPQGEGVALIAFDA